MEGKNLLTLDFKQAHDIFDSKVVIIENFISANTHEVLKNPAFDYPFSFDGLMLGICLKGRAEVKIDYKDYVISENTVYAVLPNQIFESVNKTDDLFIQLLNFSTDFLIGLNLPTDYDVFNKVLETPCLHTTDEKVKLLLNYHNLIVTSFNREKHLYSNEIIKGLLSVLLIEIIALYSESENEKAEEKMTRGKEIVKEFMKLLLAHHKQERNTAFYAEKLYMSSKYLSSVLKKETGRSINSWIYDAVITSAKILLKSSNLTVLQISEELNFPTPSFFGKFFKQYAGMTPLEFRNKK